MTQKGQEVKITANGKTLTGVVTGTSVVRSHRASERGLKLFVVANGVEYQCWCEGAQPYTAHKSAIQPCIKEESANA